MKLIDFLRGRAKVLKTEIATLYYAYKHPGTKGVPKILIFLALGYALSPIDLIPDFIPVLGYLDDLIIIPALIALSIRLLPEKILTESKKRAGEEPVRLKKNRPFAIIFISIWIILLTSAVVSLIKSLR